MREDEQSDDRAGRERLGAFGFSGGDKRSPGQLDLLRRYQQ